jgi:hypothetical protein
MKPRGIIALGLLILALGSTARGQTCPPDAPFCPLKPKVDRYLFDVRKGVSPFRTAARITVGLGERGLEAIGSGTVIEGHPDQAVVLTAAHVLKDARWIKVELFSDVLERQAGLGRPIGSWEGHAIASDPARDVALIGFRPGRRLAASPVASLGWKPDGEPMCSVGCSHGNAATAWSDKIVGKASNEGGHPIYLTLQQPVQGRSGGGLFNARGQIAGVCNAADPTARQGIYASCSSIHAVLTRMPSPPPEPPPLPSPPPSAPVMAPQRPVPSRPIARAAIADYQGLAAPLAAVGIGVPTILAAIWGSLKLIRAKLKPPSPPAPPPPTARELTPEDLMPLLVSAVQRKRAKQEADAKAATEDQAKSEQLAAVLAQVEQLLGPPPPKS